MPVEDVKNAFKERLSGGVLGTFSLFFITLNWKIWVHLFSGVEPSFRIQAISRNILSHEFILRFMAAVLLTVAYLYFIPKISRFIREYEEEEQHKLDIARIDRDLRRRAHRSQIVRELESILKFDDDVSNILSRNITISQQLAEVKRRLSSHSLVSDTDLVLANIKEISKLLGDARNRLPGMRGFITQATRDLNVLNSEDAN